MIIYLNGSFIPLEEAKLSPFDRGFLFADGVYEAIRTYNGKLFRLEDHLSRLKRSLLSIEIEYNEVDQLDSIIYKLIEKNHFASENIFIYLQITRGSSLTRTHHFPDSTISTIFITTNEIKDNDDKRNKGVKVITTEDLRWKRCDIKSISLLPAVLAKQKAHENSAEEAILVRDGVITEGTHTNFFAVRNNTVYTAPEGNFILSGITRKVVIELCNKLDIKVKEEFIKTDKLKSFDEYFITSTTKEITPVAQINDWKPGEKVPGEITQRLLDAFIELTSKLK